MQRYTETITLQDKPLFSAGIEADNEILPAHRTGGSEKEKHMKKLVSFFSASGVTRRKAKQLAGVIGADLYEIRPAVLYTAADLDWRNSASRSSVEMNDRKFRPALAETEHDFSMYTDIYVGFPIWWYTAPTIINTFLETFDFTGKRIILFATSGCSGIQKAVDELSALYPSLNITGGKLINGTVKSDIA